MGAVINQSTGHGFRFKDWTGLRIGRLVFTEYLGRNAHKHSLWAAVCDCGTKTVIANPRATQSCGCLQKEKVASIQRAKALPPDIKLQRILKNRANQRARRKADPVIAMQARLSRLHRHCLARVSAIKTSPTFESLGYSVEDFVLHIEKQFHSGMGWHNMGQWQIDHILPTSKAKTVADVIALNQLPNLRPMWAKENNAKKDKRVSLL